MNKTVGTGLRLSPTRMAKLVGLAKELAVSRNEAVGLLIEAARVESRPAISVILSTSNKNAVSTFQGENGAFA